MRYLLATLGRPDEVAARTREGLTPSEIALDLRLSFSSVLGYLETAVGRGLVRRSDVFFTLSPETRQQPSTHEDKEVISRFGDAAMGDLYADPRVLEMTLHERIRSELEIHYGREEAEWCVNGVPRRVREECSQSRERDPSRLNPYCYITFMQRKDILEASWSVLGKRAVVGRLSSDKNELKETLGQVNSIRNMVMHPSRGIEPDERDFEFIRSVRDDLRT
jgi:hypothetical protein